MLALLCGFTAAVLYRNHVGSFGISLGYFYVILVVTSGLWFGVLGGLTSALAAMAVHIAEITLYVHFQHQELEGQALFFRFSSYLAAGLVIGYYSQREKSLKKRLSQLAHFDELTGCPNHRFTLELLIGEIARARRYKRPLSLVAVDIDHFKEINDTGGHLYGNEVLKRFAGAFKTGLREIDVFGRYGGDEFLVVLPNTDGPQSEAVIERIRKNLLSDPSPSPRPTICNGSLPTFSAGIGSMPDQADDIDTLLKVADAALYQAKRLGRNRTFLERRKQGRIPAKEDLEVACQPSCEHLVEQGPAEADPLERGQVWHT
jgi:diguanylate cyclase (GGDEF)-like protein